jgi:hypothetical protein
MESELGALIESLRTGSNRLNADLQLLETNLTEVRAAVAPRTDFEPEREPLAAREPAREPAHQPPAYQPPAQEPDGPPPAAHQPPVRQPEPEPEPPALEPETASVETETVEARVEVAAPAQGPEPVASGVGGGLSDGAEDTEGARLIALNMALNGTPREETDRYLAENFKLRDRAALLDEVYASVEG